MIHIHDGTEEGITTFTDRGVESLQEFLADVRTWEGGIRKLLIQFQGEEVVEARGWNAGEDVGEPSLRVDVVELRRGIRPYMKASLSPPPSEPAK
jgi:hypothetical protein